MSNLASHIERLLRLSSKAEREHYVREHAELKTCEGARLLCRTAVLETTQGVKRTRILCEALDAVAAANPEDVVQGYRAHAWAAHYDQGRSDYQNTVRHWKLAHSYFEAAGRSDEAAITCYCALQALDFVNEVELFWKWEEEARTHFEKTADRLRLARLRANVATAYLRRGKGADAAQLLEASVADFLVSAASPRDFCAAFLHLSACHQSLGDLPRSGAFLERARQLCEDANLPHLLPVVLGNFAFVKCLEGDFFQALLLLRDELTRLTREGETESYPFYMAAFVEAEVLRGVGLAAEGGRSARLARDGFSRLGLKGEEASALLSIGGCIQLQGRPSAALQFFDEASRLFEESLHLEGQRLSALARATALHAKGACEASDRIVRRLLSEGGLSPLLLIKSHLLLSKILLAKEDLSNARKNLEDVLSRVVALGQPLLEAEALFILGVINERSGLALLAYNVYSHCERCISRVRSKLTLADLKIAFLSDKADLYESLFSVGASLGHTPTELLAHAEGAKSRTLADRVATRLYLESCIEEVRGTPDFEGLLHHLLDSFNHLEDLNNEGGRETLEAAVHGGPSTAGAAVKHLLGAVGIHKGHASSALSELPTRLPRDTALVEFYFARGTVYAFLLIDGRLTSTPLTDTRSIHRLCHLAQFHLRPRTSSAADQSAPSEALLHYLRKLYDALWLKIDIDASIRRLVVVPHGLLHAFPLHALFDGYHYLADRYAISYAPSARFYSMARSRPRNTARRRSVVIGAPDDCAPAIATEVESVAANLPDAIVFVNEAARRDEFVRELPDARYIHIATHGGFDRVKPRRSFLTLPDAPFTVRDLQHLKLSADLVVMSGCETGGHGLRTSDELIGLTQAVLEAGARAALVSLWPVADSSTAALMQRFYSHLIDDEGHDLTLQRAMISHREDFSNPFFWAPFVLVGDPGP